MAKPKCAEAGCVLDAVVEINGGLNCEEHGKQKFKAKKATLVNPLYISTCDAEGVHPVLPLRTPDGKRVE